MIVKDSFVQINPTTYFTGNTYSRAIHQFNGHVYLQANLLGPNAPYKATEVDTLLTAKQDTITGAATTITSSNLTVDRALISDPSGKL
jgi:hypothetical protein